MNAGVGYAALIGVFTVTAVIGFYGAILGWREIDQLRLPDRMTIAVGKNCYVNLRERDGSCPSRSRETRTTHSPRGAPSARSRFERPVLADTSQPTRTRTGWWSSTRRTRCAARTLRGTPRWSGFSVASARTSCS